MLISLYASSSCLVVILRCGLRGAATGDAVASAVQPVFDAGTCIKLAFGSCLSTTIYSYLQLSTTIYNSIYLSIYPSIHPSIHPSIYLSIYLSIRVHNTVLGLSVRQEACPVTNIFTHPKFRYSRPQLSRKQHLNLRRNYAIELLCSSIFCPAVTHILPSASTVRNSKSTLSRVHCLCTASVFPGLRSFVFSLHHSNFASLSLSGYAASDGVSAKAAWPPGGFVEVDMHKCMLEPSILMKIHAYVFLQHHEHMQTDVHHAGLQTDIDVWCTLNKFVCVDAR